MTLSTNCKTIFCWFAIFVFPSISLGQIHADKPHWYFESTVRYGRIIPNSKDFNYLWDIAMYGMDFRFGKQTTGVNEWEQWFNYPDFGVALRYVNFNDDRFGNNLALFGYMNGALFRFDKLSINYSIGLGIMHWVKHYDPLLNPENVLIGSPLNAHIDLTLGVEYMLSDATDIFLKTNFSHTSNGALVLPNKGINVLSGLFGLRYHVNNRLPRIKTIDTITSFVPVNRLYFFIAPGFRQSKVDFNYYPKYVFQIGYSRQFHPKFSFGGGIDLNYSGELALLLPKSEQSEWKYYSQAAFSSFELTFDRLIMHFAFGVYLNQAFSHYTPYYERAGIRVVLGKERKHFVGFAIKAHAGSADFLEWTYGYNFFKWFDRKPNRINKS
jgi:hypothetical protein